MNPLSFATENRMPPEPPCTVDQLIHADPPISVFMPPPEEDQDPVCKSPQPAPISKKFYECALIYVDECVDRINPNSNRFCAPIALLRSQFAVRPHADHIKALAACC